MTEPMHASRVPVSRDTRSSARASRMMAGSTPPASWAQRVRSPLVPSPRIDRKPESSPAAARHTNGQGTHDRRRLAEHVPLHACDLKTGRADRIDRRAVAVAAVTDEHLKSVEPVLPPREPRLLGTDVLDEQQLAARLEDAPQ